MNVLKRVTAPSSYPVSLTEAKAQCRVDHSDEDTLIELFIGAATEDAEKFLGRSLIEQTWDLYLDAFPSGPIVLPKPPLIAVVGVFYQDSAGDEQEFEAFEADIVSEPGRVFLPTSGSWPTPATTLNAVRVRFRAGYVDTADSPPSVAVPDSIKAAVLLTIGTLYQHRETVVIGATTNLMPWSAEQILRKHRIDLSMA